MTHTVRGVADEYTVTEHTVLGWIAAGELEAVNVGRAPGKRRPRWRITDEALRKFELRRSTAAKQVITRQRKSQPAKPDFY